MLKVIGAGFGRTGTFTLKTVLEALDFGPCYHMFEVSQNPGHDELWKLAADDPAFPWDLFFERYVSAVDWPAAAFYDQLMKRYPQAKVILTVRDPDAWYESARTTIARHHFEPDNDIATSDRMPDKIIWRGVFDGRFADRTHALAVFRRHIEEVRRRVPQDRLLVYDAQEGWEPICRFLGVEPPAGVAFPRVNTGDEWRARQARRQAASEAEKEGEAAS